MLRTKALPNLLLYVSFLILLLFLSVSFVTSNFNYFLASLVTIGLINTSIWFDPLPFKYAQRNKKKAIRIRKF